MAEKQISEFIPPEGTPEHFDYLLDSLEAETRLSERYGISLDSIVFYKDMLRVAYQHARERTDSTQPELRQKVIDL